MSDKLKGLITRKYNPPHSLQTICLEFCRSATFSKYNHIPLELEDTCLKKIEIITILGKRKSICHIYLVVIQHFSFAQKPLGVTIIYLAVLNCNETQSGFRRPRRSAEPLLSTV